VEEGAKILETISLFIAFSCSVNEGVVQDLVLGMGIKAFLAILAALNSSLVYR
jgi:hypothetical protein